jgi:DNA-binding NtrC family response regulator
MRVANPPVDIVILAAEWQPRALIRAQLIEEGFEVAAADTWPMTREHLGPESRVRLAIVDLQGLANPAGVLDELSARIDPHHVLVLTAIGTLDTGELARRGFHMLSRPFGIEDVVRAVSRIQSTG